MPNGEIAPLSAWQYAECWHRSQAGSINLDMRRLPIISIVWFLLLASVHAKQHPYIRYDFSQIYRTADDHRICMTGIFLTADDYVGFRYREQVFGSIRPSVSAVAFRNAYERKATRDEQDQLIQSLLEAGILTMASESKSDKAVYFGSLHFQTDSEERQIYFYTPPTSPERVKVHEVLLDFAKRMKIDQPIDQKKSVTITEGDNQPPRKLKLVDVLADPEKYDGKRISVVGFYHGEFEGSSFSVDKVASKQRDYARSVWLSDSSSLANKSNINLRNDSWLRIDGIFLCGPGGHMGLWPGELDRPTRIEPVAKPE